MGDTTRGKALETLAPKLLGTLKSLHQDKVAAQGVGLLIRFIYFDQMISYIIFHVLLIIVLEN